MGDTESGSWGSSGLEGYLRREEMREMAQLPMTGKQIRAWGEDTERFSGVSATQDVSVIQAQATLELAAQVSELREMLHDAIKALSSDGFLDVQVRRE